MTYGNKNWVKTTDGGLSSGCLVILKNGTMGIQQQITYPDWWKGFFRICDQTGESIRYHRDDVVSIWRFKC